MGCQPGQGTQCLKALVADQLGPLDVYEVALVDVQDLTMAQPPPSYPIRKSGGCAKFHRMNLKKKKNASNEHTSFKNPLSVP